MAIVKSSADEGAALAALGMARDAPLPIEAVGRSRGEIAWMHAKKAFIVMGIYAAFCAFVVIGLSSEGGMAERDAQALGKVFPVMGLAFAGAFGLLIAWISSQGVPGTSVTVDAEGVRVSAEGQEHLLPHDAIEFRIIHWRFMRGGTLFAGVGFDLPSGEIKLTDRWFEQGALAAAAIVHQAEQRGRLWPKEGEEPRWPF